MSSHLSPSLPFRGPTVGERPLASLGLGLALLFGVPGVAVLLVIAVVGLVLGLILLFAYPVLLMAGFFAGLLFAGDALFRLAGEGLIDITSRTGTYVKNITEADIHEILQTRLILETAVIEEITAKITDEQLQFLKDLYQRGASLVVNPNDSESYRAFMEYDSEFHLFFFHVMGNRRLLDIYRHLNAHMQMVRFRLMNRGLGKLPTTDEEHRMILEALCERNVAKAKHAIANHLRRLDAVCRTVRQD